MLNKPNKGEPIEKIGSPLFFQGFWYFQYL